MENHAQRKRNAWSSKDKEYSITMGQLRRVESNNGAEIGEDPRKQGKQVNERRSKTTKKGRKNTRQLRKATQKQKKRNVHSETSNSDIIVQIPDTINNVHRRLGDQSPRDKEGRGDTDRDKLPR